MHSMNKIPVGGAKGGRARERAKRLAATKLSRRKSAAAASRSVAAANSAYARKGK